jgi:hypothetical protein
MTEDLAAKLATVRGNLDAIHQELLLRIQSAEARAAEAEAKVVGLETRAAAAETKHAGLLERVKALLEDRPSPPA